MANNKTQRASQGNLSVRITDDLILDAGTWHISVDDEERPIARITPPGTPMFLQVVEYLERKDLQTSGYVRLADETRAAAGVCIRLGSYFAVLADASQSYCPDARDAGVSHIDNDEMARMNIEISAALEWWLTLKGTDEKRYTRLVSRALKCLPLGRKSVGRTELGDMLWAFSTRAMAEDVKSRWTQERMDNCLSVASRYPARVIANWTTIDSWRHGPLENVHAGRFVGHALNERRILPKDEKAVIRQAQDALYGALRAADYLRWDAGWPPPPDRVVAFMSHFFYPTGWTYTEQSRAINLPLRPDMASY